MSLGKVQSKCLLKYLLFTGCLIVTSVYAQGLYDVMLAMSRQDTNLMPVLIKNSTGYGIKNCKVKFGDKDWQELKESKDKFVTILKAYKSNAMSYETMDIDIQFVMRGSGIFSARKNAGFRIEHWLGTFSYELIKRTDDQFELKVTGGDRSQRLQTEQLAQQGDRMRAQNQQMQQMIMNNMILQSATPMPYVAPAPIGSYHQPKVETPKGYCARHNCHYELTKGCHFCSAPNFGDTNPWRVRGNWDGDIK